MTTKQRQQLGTKAPKQLVNVLPVEINQSITVSKVKFHSQSC